MKNLESEEKRSLWGVVKPPLRDLMHLVKALIRAFFLTIMFNLECINFIVFHKMEVTDFTIDYNLLKPDLDKVSLVDRLNNNLDSVKGYDTEVINIEDIELWDEEDE